MKKDSKPVPSRQESQSFRKVYPLIDENIAFFKDTFSGSDDLMIKEFKVRNNRGILVSLNTMADKDKIHNVILKPVMEAEENEFENVLKSTFQKSENLIKAEKALLNGACVVIFEGDQQFYMLEVTISRDRAVMEPSNEQIIQGSHEGFIENLMTNLHLVRKSIRTSDLTMEHLTVGEQIQTKISMVYLKNLANKEIISEFKRRVEHISLDHIPSIGYLQELVEDST